MGLGGWWGPRVGRKGEVLLDDLFLVLLSGFGAGFLGGLSPLPQTLPPTFVLPK